MVAGGGALSTGRWDRRLIMPEKVVRLVAAAHAVPNLYSHALQPYTGCFHLHQLFHWGGWCVMWVREKKSLCVELPSSNFLTC